MGNWTVDATPRAAAAKAQKDLPDWTRLQHHLQEIGILHASLYRLARAGAPAFVLCSWWFVRHPGLMFQGPAWWYIPRVSILEVGMLVAVTLVAHFAAGRRHASRDEMLHHEVASSLLSALLCALITVPCSGAWSLFGASLSRVLRDPRVTRPFNWTMAALLVASIAPTLFE